ncbi:hypothetical protein FBUS_10447 [Fasciolopsis buskii]|uniref:Uncharacterized protein n=1 Tax=Fasciolopsis buskii TaxID=27845 RepID=A0A8E0S4K7_9TREM|nr:hypothetical protein FBUS_10447 [Fasciolopsis buski]
MSSKLVTFFVGLFRWMHTGLKLENAKRLRNLAVHQFIHPQQAVRLLIFAKWCSAHGYLSSQHLEVHIISIVYLSQSLLLSKMDSSGVIMWIKKRKPHVSFDNLLEKKEPVELQRSLYEKYSIEQLVDLLNSENQVTRSLGGKGIYCISSKDQLVPSIQSDLHECELFKDPKILTTDPIKLECSAIHSPSDRKITLEIILFLDERKRRLYDISPVSDSHPSKKHRNSPSSIDVNCIADHSHVAEQNAILITNIRNSHTSSTLFTSFGSPHLGSPQICVNANSSTVPVTCTSSGSPFLITHQGDAETELTMLGGLSNEDLETMTPERLHSLEESQMTIPNTVLIDKKVQHNDSEISFADQSTIPANVMQDTNLLTAKPILDCKSLSRERLFELKGTESEETLELRSHLLGLIVSKADSSTVAESPTTVFETIGSPAGFSEEHLPLTPTESTMRVDSTPSSEYLMIPSQEKPELSTTNALLPKLERSPTFDWSHNSVVSDALTVGKTHLKLFKFEPVHNSREHLDLPILQHTEFLNPLPSSLDEPNQIPLRGPYSLRERRVAR